MRRRLGLLSCLLSVCLPSVWACGAPASVQTGPDPACEGARSDAAAAWARVAARAEVAAAPPEHAASAAESALDRLNDHLSALRESPREVEGDEAMALSSSVMDGIDEVSGELSARVRERADDAAEALLTDRSEQGAVRAAEGAIVALEAVLEEARPGSREERRARAAARELARRAGRAAEAYERSVPEGDRAADRAEVSPAVEPLGELRDEARDASRAARAACGVDRVLAVPR